jgi:hypothetical protein
LKGVRPGAALNMVFESLGVNDRFEVKQGPVKNFVDYNEVELRGLCHLDRSEIGRAHV